MAQLLAAPRVALGGAPRLFFFLCVSVCKLVDLVCELVDLLCQLLVDCVLFLQLAFKFFDLVFGVVFFLEGGQE